MKELLVIKIGGNIIDDEEALQRFLTDLASIEMTKILVHGGGKLATDLSDKLSIPTNMVDGRRITDDDTIRVVTMTYAGWINKYIVAQLQSKNCNAIGLSGADAKLLPAVKRSRGDIDYGWVGDMESKEVNTQILDQLLKSGLTVVVAPITCNREGQLLNVNADTVACIIAKALSKDFRTNLIYCFEKNGLLLDMNDETSLIAEIDEMKVSGLKASGAISKGMVPKIDNALSAAKNDVSTVIIGHASHIKAMAKKQIGYGTYINA